MVTNDILIKRESVILHERINENNISNTEQREMNLNEAYDQLLFDLKNNKLNTCTVSMMNLFIILMSILTF